MLVILTFSKTTLNYKQFLKTKEYQQVLKEGELEAKNFDFQYSKIKSFPCKKLSSNHPEPEDASKLRFTDIKVMMSLGDSITAGFGMVKKKCN